MSFLKRRFKLSINEAKRDDLFKQLTRGNEQLRTLLDTSDQIATLHRDRRVAKKSTDMVGMRQFWKRTDKLYGLLRRSWTCDCRKDHSASLLLKHRTSATTDFQLFLFNGTRDQQDEEELTWKVQEVKVEVLQSMSEECGFKESKVSFATLPSSTPRVTVTARETTDGNIGPSSYEDMIRIRCLCEEIPKFHAHLDRKRPYLLSHADCSVSVHPLLHSSPNATVTAGDMVSLESLLRKSSTRRLTRQARYLIGLTLASSYLQLKFSPWLSHHWTKRDILFPKGKPGKDIVATELPYISQNFELPQCGSDVDARHGTPYDGDDDAADEEDAPADSGGFEPNDHGLKSLGIMLLELCFNTAMEEYGPRMQYVPQQPSGANEPGASNPFLDVAAAFQWSRDVVGEAGPEFSDAIMWCLTTVPNSAARDRMGDRWRDELFERVIMPLKYCCDQFAYQKKTAFVY